MSRVLTRSERARLLNDVDEARRLVESVLKRLDDQKDSALDFSMPVYWTKLDLNGANKRLSEAMDDLESVTVVDV